MIDSAPMADLDNENKKFLVLNFGQDTIVPDSIPPKLPKLSFKGLTSCSWILGDTLTKVTDYPSGFLYPKLFEVFFCLWG